ncbi:MAG TPA: carbohydrate-binding domain-containing protein [Gemmataceae bacterium]|nr:carbohydrate-binding domain-containing protein [Gemmataceae bacterium]
MFRIATLLVTALVLGSATAAADPIKADLKSFKWKAAFDGAEQLGGYDENENRFFFYTNGSASGEITIPEDGEYTITVEASCNEAKKVFAAFKLTVGDVVVTKEHFLKAEEAKPYTFTAKLTKGKQKLVIEFLNDEFKEGEYDRNLYVHAVMLEKK